MMIKLASADFPLRLSIKWSRWCVVFCPRRVRSELALSELRARLREFLIFRVAELNGAFCIANQSI